MTTAPQPLTKIVGKTERTLQALLNTQLGKADLSFPEWTVLVFLSNGSLARTAVLTNVEEAEIARGDNADALVATLEARGLVGISDEIVHLTDKGLSLFTPLRDAVKSITAGLVAGIPQADMEATNRTLAIVAARAEGMLESGSPEAA